MLLTLYRDPPSAVDCEEMRLLLSLLFAGALYGQTDWSAIAKQDIAATDRWIRDYYAGAVDPQNPGFEQQWSTAVNLANSRAAQITTEAGYRYTLRALANSLRDGHVFVNFNSTATGLRWAGIASELRGERYNLRTLPGSTLDIPDGALLISCDGKPISEIARERLDLFVANWDIPARRIAAFSQFFLDAGNPFVPRPQSCEYRREPSIAVLKLDWTDVAASEAGTAFAPFRRILAGRAQFTLEYKPDGAAWITVPNLADDNANKKLIGEVKAAKARLTGAPYIVVDVRGNGGGNSGYADGLAQAIWGEGTLKQGLPQTRPKSWRATPAVLELVTSKKYDWLIPRLKKAIAEHRPLAAEDNPPNAARQSRKPDAMPSVFLLTDGGCFSSCVLMTNLFRRMGAIQAGDPTDRNGIYGENAFFRDLPSGKAKLSIPLALFGLPDDELGGGPPDLPWQGAAGDQQGIERMIREHAAKLRGH